MNKFSLILLGIVIVASSGTAKAQNEIGYCGRQGVFTLKQDISGGYQGTAILQLPNSQTGQRELVRVNLVADHWDYVKALAYTTSSGQQVWWPREHNGLVFKTNLNSKYPALVFLAINDAASSSSAGIDPPYVYPAAYKQDFRWEGLEGFKRMPVGMRGSSLNSNEDGSAGGYAAPKTSGDEGDGAYSQTDTRAKNETKKKAKKPGKRENTGDENTRG